MLAIQKLGHLQLQKQILILRWLMNKYVKRQIVIQEHVNKYVNFVSTNKIKSDELISQKVHSPYQPKNIVYPYNDDTHRRRFQPPWFVSHKDWLEYSPSMDALYCLPCITTWPPQVCIPGYAPEYIIIYPPNHVRWASPVIYTRAQDDQGYCS